MKTFSYALLLFLLWIPRILGILFAILLSLFAFDVFGFNAGFWRTLLAFLSQLIPAFLVAGFVILSWKWQWVGGIAFLILGIAYIVYSSGQGHSYSLIYIPLFVLSLLFLAGWFLKKQIKTAQDALRGDI